MKINNFITSASVLLLSLSLISGCSSNNESNNPGSHETEKNQTANTPMNAEKVTGSVTVKGWESSPTLVFLGTDEYPDKYVAYQMNGEDYSSFSDELPKPGTLVDGEDPTVFTIEDVEPGNYTLTAVGQQSFEDPIVLKENVVVGNDKNIDLGTFTIEPEYPWLDVTAIVNQRAIDESIKLGYKYALVLRTEDGVIHQTPFTEEPTRFIIGDLYDESVYSAHIVKYTADEEVIEQFAVTEESFKDKKGKTAYEVLIPDAFLT